MTSHNLRPLTVLVATLSLLVAACGGATIDGAETTAPTTTTMLPPASTTTAPPAPDVTTTEGPATTTTTGPPATTPTTSTSTSTTVVEPPPANGVIVGYEGVLGWWDGTTWRTLDSGEPPAAPGDAYQVLQLGEETLTVFGGPLTGGCEFVEGSRAIDVGIEVDDWPQSTPIAVSTDDELLPHPVELLESPPAIYGQIVSDLLATRGVVDPDPGIAQVIRTDLEGDGVDEILIAAERNATGQLVPADAGDYSILLLRKLVQGEVATAVIADFYSEEPPVEGGIVFLDRLRFTAVADFNGDGKMEIAFTSQYYEGSSTHLVEYADDDLGPIQVLSVGCGV